MSNKKQQQYKQITHPDEFVEGKKYSVFVEGSNGFRRYIGIFVEMESEWCELCQQNHLLIHLKRRHGRMDIVCWNDLGIKDWREIS